MMRKSVKSLQNVLNEAQKEISLLLKNDEETITEVPIRRLEKA